MSTARLSARISGLSSERLRGGLQTLSSGHFGSTRSSLRGYKPNPRQTPSLDATLLKDIEHYLKYYHIPVREVEEIDDGDLLEQCEDNSGIMENEKPEKLTDEISNILRMRMNFSSGFVEANYRCDNAPAFLWIAAHPFLWIIEAEPSKGSERQQKRMMIRGEVKTIFRSGRSIIISYDSSLDIFASFDFSTNENEKPLFQHNFTDFDPKEYISYGNETHMASNKGRILKYSVKQNQFDSLQDFEKRRNPEGFIVSRIVEFEGSVYVLYKERFNSKISAFTSEGRHKFDYQDRKHRITDITVYNKELENNVKQKTIVAIQSPGEVLELADDDKRIRVDTTQTIFSVSVQRPGQSDESADTETTSVYTNDKRVEDMTGLFSMNNTTIYTWSSNGIMFCHDPKSNIQTDIVVARLQGLRTIFHKSMHCAVVAYGPISDGYVVLTPQGIFAFREKSNINTDDAPVDDRKSWRRWFIAREIGERWGFKELSKETLRDIKHAMKQLPVSSYSEWEQVETVFKDSTGPVDMAKLLFDINNSKLHRDSDQTLSIRVLRDVFNRSKLDELAMMRAKKGSSHTKTNSMEELEKVLETHANRSRKFDTWIFFAVVLLIWLIAFCLLIL